MDATPGFADAIDIVLDAEGVLSDDKRDPGDLTACGIARAHNAGETAFWDLVERWRGGHADFEAVRQAAIGIYARKYWSHYRCGALPWPLSLLLFDGVVNQTAFVPGPEDGIVEMLQEALGVVSDGIIGPRTIGRAQGLDRPGLLRVVDDFCARRALRYAQKSNLDAFGLGLFRRIMKMHGKAVRYVA